MLTFKPIPMWKRILRKWFGYATGGQVKRSDMVIRSIPPHTYQSPIWLSDFKKIETDEYQRQRFMKNLAKGGDDL